MYFYFNHCATTGACCAFTVKDGAVSGTYLDEDENSMKSFECAATEELALSLEALLEKYKVEKWKGGRIFRHFAFASSFDTFTLEYSFPSGMKGEANTAGGIPKEFSEFLAEVRAIFIG